MKAILNDFNIQVATVNGSGSQTANSVLLRAIFQMGIPVSGKNLFPSNIAGLPTWFTIRVSRDGYVARWHGREYEASPDGADLRLYTTHPEPGFEQVRTSRLTWRRDMPTARSSPSSRVRS